jgi:hypothetical protein
MPDRSPTLWVFNEADRLAHAKRFWRASTRLVTAGLWAKLWRASGTTRGGGIVTSLLPVLALHTWPEQSGAEVGWTGWSYLSRHRLAALAGINKDSVGAACHRLVALNLMELERRPRARHEGGYKTYFRLAASRYPQADEPYAMLPGNLFYSGTWAVLPSPAYRHLYVVITCLDPIGDEAAYLARIAEDIGGNWDRYADDEAWTIADPAARAVAIQTQMLAAQRARHPLSIRDLVEYSGLQRNTAVEALRGLLVPMFGNYVDPQTGHCYPPIALLKHGEVQPGRPTWYAPDRRAWGWSWRCEVMNARDRVQKARDRLWPHFVERSGRG